MDVLIGIDEVGSPTLALGDAENLNTFQVVVTAVAKPLQEISDQLDMKYEEHLWVPVARIRALARPVDPRAWEARLDRMIEYAAARGWYDSESRAIRAHCVYR